MNDEWSADAPAREPLSFTQTSPRELIQRGLEPVLSVALEVSRCLRGRARRRARALRLDALDLHGLARASGLDHRQGDLHDAQPVQACRGWLAAGGDRVL